MSDPFDADELWFAHLLASVPTPASLERAAARPARPASGRRRRYRTLVLAGGLALVVGVLGGLVLGLTRAGDKSAGAPATGPAVPAPRGQPGLAAGAGRGPGLDLGLDRVPLDPGDPRRRSLQLRRRVDGLRRRHPPVGAGDRAGLLRRRRLRGHLDLGRPRLVAAAARGVASARRRRRPRLRRRQPAAHPQR